MPMLGLGTWENEDPDQCAESVLTALETGYRHIDTAQAYGNEGAVGDGIAAADVDRDEIFLATKVWISNLDYEDVLETTQESLDRLGTDYLDLLYVHWPSRTYEPGSTLEAFDELYEEGTIRNIGVSNFEPRHIDEAREHLDAPIFANQVETHPMLQQRELREYGREHDIEIVAYSPLARGDVFEIDVLSEIAEKHGVSEAQVSLAWLRENDVTAIPKATSEAHIQDNWESLTLELDEADLRQIDSIDRTRRKVDPGFAPW
ncbi:Aldo/keto reductase, related to diketogulonate reductase [Halapricum desulfuricans]|uniref:Aldo/keto reductase, related to diketogulonate reductase n=2 Tax=Halapricum desulfuricans TaxID=2841257 RepID=A0A897NCP2_9EURY|nr:aldo/keto reductase [Halapricum desulfuricans]QSG12180.1 Aldo/keto reductase, related to diketogulonate reductase [Halapricum desulfuricans]